MLGAMKFFQQCLSDPEKGQGGPRLLAQRRISRTVSASAAWRSAERVDGLMKIRCVEQGRGGFRAAGGLAWVQAGQFCHRLMFRSLM